MTAVLDNVDLARDRELVERAQSGDPSGFEELYTVYYERVVRFAQKRIQDRGVAEEIAQETFVRAYRALPSFAGERRFYPWLTVIASRLCIDHIRRSARVELGGVDDNTIWLDHGFDRVDAESDIAQVTAAMDRLSPRHREVLDPRERQGWTYQDIADHYSVSLGTIEALLWRARRALKREFQEAGAAIASLPAVRRLASLWHRVGAMPVSAAVGTLGTVAALGLSGGLVPAAAAPTAVPLPAVSVVTWASGAAPAQVATVPGSAPAPTTAPLSTLVTPHASAAGARTIGAAPAGVIASVGAVQVLTPEAGQQRISQEPLQVHIGGVNVGGNLGPLNTPLQQVIQKLLPNESPKDR